MSILEDLLNEKTKILTQIDDLTLSKTRKRMNSKKQKNRVYGVDQSPMSENITADVWKEIGIGLAHAEENEESKEDDLDFEHKKKHHDEKDDHKKHHHDEHHKEKKKPKNPRRQGMIRRVKGAHLVYKKQVDESEYEELWIFNTQNSLQDELKIKKAILAGTDIKSNKLTSDDGVQSYELVTLGNAQLLCVRGLPQ